MGYTLHYSVHHLRLPDAKTSIHLTTLNMKKNLATSLFLLVFVIIFTSCTSVSSNKIAYRVFYLSREQDNGNLSLNTDSDIPNGYECILEENMVLDSGGNEMR